MISTAMRMANREAVAPLTDPLGAIPWTKAAWADDPAWTNPGNGNTVTTWRNAGSVAGDFTNVSSPVFRASVAAFNGHAAVELVSGWMQTSAFVLAEPFTIVWIGKRLGAAGGGYERMVELSNENSPFLCLTMNGPSGSGTLKWALVGGGSFVLNSTISYDTNPHAIRGIFNAASSSIEVDSVATNGTLGGISSTAAMRLGSNTNANQQMAFVGLYPGNLTTHAQWPAFRAWVASNYNLVI
jgi:hypothetical protein